MVRAAARVAVAVIAVVLSSAAQAQVPVLRAVQSPGPESSFITEPMPAAFVLTSPQGVKVFLDVTVVPPDLRPALEDPKNIFVATHDHPDHMNLSLLNRFPGAHLRGGGHPVEKPGAVVWTASSGDVKVSAIASSHLDDELDGSTNVIVVVEVAGIKVVHMGDCGQTALSPAQRKVIGRPDVMIQLLEDALQTEADVANQKAFKLVAQVGPTILVPTHIASAPAVKLLEAGGYALDVAQKDELALGPALLGGKRRAVFMGVNRGMAAKAGVKASGQL